MSSRASGSDSCRLGEALREDSSLRKRKGISLNFKCFLSMSLFQGIVKRLKNTWGDWERPKSKKFVRNHFSLFVVHGLVIISESSFIFLSGRSIGAAPTREAPARGLDGFLANSWGALGVKTGKTSDVIGTALDCYRWNHWSLCPSHVNQTRESPASRETEEKLTPTTSSSAGSCLMFNTRPTFRR